MAELCGFQGCERLSTYTTLRRFNCMDFSPITRPKSTSKSGVTCKVSVWSLPEQPMPASRFW